MGSYALPAESSENEDFARHSNVSYCCRRRKLPRAEFRDTRRITSTRRQSTALYDTQHRSVRIIPVRVGAKPGRTLFVLSLQQRPYDRGQLYTQLCTANDSRRPGFRRETSLQPYPRVTTSRGDVRCRHRRER